MTYTDYFELKTNGNIKPTDFIPASFAIEMLQEFGKLQYNEAIDDAMANVTLEYEPLTHHTIVNVRMEMLYNLKKK
jgi:hypothetical protein